MSMYLRYPGRVNNSHLYEGRGSAVLGSFRELSLASRRKRGPVAFHPRLSVGLALSLLVVLHLYA